MSRAGLSDTSPDAQRVLVAAYRAMSPARKWELLHDLIRFGRILHAGGVRLRKPEATSAEIRADWVALHFGRFLPLSPFAEGSSMTRSAENEGVLLEVLNVFDSLGIAYALGGSFASSIHGIMRNTTDADLTAEPFSGKEAQFVRAFSPDFYVSEDAVREAVRQRSSFNIINTAVGFKIDVFLRRERPFERSLMQRRARFVPPETPDRPISLVTAEDIVLLKLEWYRLGGEVSEQQWKDVLNVLRVQAGRLDDAYLDHWAADLKVADLLAEARREAASG